MKKTIVNLLVFAMILSLVGCGDDNKKNDVSPDAASTSVSEETETPTVNSDENGNDSSVNASGKTLILYFSSANTKDVDAVSQATSKVGDISSTEWIAKTIQEKVGGDIEKLIPSVDYPLDYDACADAAKEETDSDARPEFEPLELDPAEYDTIFIGYPMWWYTIPMVLETFFDKYDLTGKTIIPFNTHEGSGDGGTYDTIRECEPGATVSDGIAIRGGNAGSDDAKNEIDQWLMGLGY